jgi:phenylpyruvate tautomerase PptA (4-oxalocrotonate tautomerase family)
MPTYACSILAGRLTPAQKAEIVRCITTVQHEETGAPRYLVQVIFYELASGNHYVAGELARPEQIWIRGDLRSGRTEEQKAQILRRILQGVAKSTDAPEEAVWVYLSDIPATNIAEYGRILPLPGEENAWFEMLPDPLKARLSPLA